MLVCGGGLFRGHQRDGKPEGFGECTWPDGTVYSGSWNDGLPNGLGHFRFANGEDFEGEWVDGNRRGLGAWTGVDESEYHGEFNQCSFCGSGFMRQGGTGTVFHGIYDRGLRSGSGLSISKDGCVYAGSFKNDMRHGSGLEILAEDNIRIATDVIYENDRLVYRQPRWVSRGGTLRTVAGKATAMRTVGGVNVAFETVVRQRSRPFSLRLESGMTYVGQTRELQLDGRGRAVYPADDTEGRREYEGGFHEGLCHGVGVLYWRDEASYAGMWEKGAPAGFGVYTFSRPSAASFRVFHMRNELPSFPRETSAVLSSPYVTYEGGFSAGNFHGFGVLTKADGSELYATFAAGSPTGACVLIRPGGERLLCGDAAKAGSPDSHQTYDGSAEKKANDPKAHAIEVLAVRAQTVARALASTAQGGPALIASRWTELESLEWRTLWPRNTNKICQ